MSYTEKILNKIAYADGNIEVNPDKVTVEDHGKTYSFGIGPVAYAVGAPKDMSPVQGVAYKILGFKKDEEELFV